MSILPFTTTTMLSLDTNRITELYAWVDDHAPREQTGQVGRPRALSTSEVVTILVWNVIMIRQRTLKDIYRWIKCYHHQEFPTLPAYNCFLVACQRALPVMWVLLEQLLRHDAPLVFVDSTMMPVCKLVRADRHKVAVSIAQFGKNHQGWHYGLKGHLAVDVRGRLCQVVFTPANVHDGQVLPWLVNKQMTIAVGDSHYGATVMRQQIWERFHVAVFSRPHYTQRKKILTLWQEQLLEWRSIVESTFDYLKDHLNLVTSFPRSITGYFVHYVRILLGYQILALELA